MDLDRFAHVLTGTILTDPMADEIMVGLNDAPIPCIIGDATGKIRFEEIDGGVLSMFKGGDKIRVIGATVVGTVIRLLQRGSVIKIGSATEPSLQFLESKEGVNPSFRTAIINQEQNYGGIKIILHKLKVFEDYTVLFVTIENLSKDADISLYKQGCRIL